MRKFAFFLAILLSTSLSVPFAQACCDAEYKEITAKCIHEQLNRGKPQADAEKSCQCEIDVVSKKANNDLIVLYVALMKNDDNSIRSMETAKGSEWVANGVAALMKIALEVGNTCNAK